MKISLLQENLEKAVLLTSRIVNAKTQLPILTNLLFEAKKEGLFISATNLETSIVVGVPAKTEEVGKITLPAKTLQELVISLPKEKVVLETEKERVKIVCHPTKVKVNGMEAAEFPGIPDVDKSVKPWKLKSEDFIKACSQVVFAASQDEARPALTGVRLSGEKEGWELVATDGYRLSKKTIVGKVEAGRLMIIPARTLNEIIRMIGEEEEILIYPEKKQQQIIFTFANIRLVSRLIDADFPPFAKVIPTSWETEISLDKEQFSRALKTASIFARSSANIIKLKVDADPKTGQKVNVSANAPSVGENESEIEAKVKGEAVEIAFNYRFVQEFLAVTQTDQIAIKLNGGVAPAIFEAVGDKSFLHVIMPVRVQKPEG